MISVIVAVYNVASYLDKCITSIRRQTYTDLEIILVDDGSTDNSGEVCDMHKQSDSRIQVLHKNNGGLSDSRNAGIEMATGDYLSFIDGDDYIHPRMFEILLQNLQSYGGDISLCSFRHVAANEQPTKLEVTNNVRKEEFPLKELMASASEIASACNKIYRRELFRDIRYPIGKLHEDEFVIHRLLDKSSGIVCTDAKLYYYVKREGSITSTVHTAKIDDLREAVLERFELLKLRKLPEVRHYTVRMIIGNMEYTYALLKKTTQDKKAVKRAIKRSVWQVLCCNRDILCKKEKAGILCFIILPEIWIRHRRKLKME